MFFNESKPEQNNPNGEIYYLWAQMFNIEFYIKREIGNILNTKAKQVYYPKLLKFKNYTIYA